MVDVTPLAGLKNLYQLSLMSNRIVDIKPLSSLNPLYLYLDDNPIKDKTCPIKDAICSFWMLP
ncbi:hypothetical protein [Calothrix sp. PCC 6303]|uniref:hypothetical protein n=1 Tax=Calothrix sp. PCC 6303 TaxID=1170562 RepID=UPI000A06791C